MQRQARLQRELENLKRQPADVASVYPKSDDRLDLLEAQITGPEGTPYENGLFRLELQIPENYPFAPPSVKFLTKVYHPNVDDSGRICMDLIKTRPKGCWNPTMGLEGLLVAVKVLMRCPNADDPLMADIAHEFTHNREEYTKKATSWTLKYAK